MADSLQDYSGSGISEVSSDYSDENNGTTSSENAYVFEDLEGEEEYQGLMVVGPYMHAPTLTRRDPKRLNECPHRFHDGNICHRCQLSPSTVISISCHSSHGSRLSAVGTAGCRHPLLRRRPAGEGRGGGGGSRGRGEGQSMDCKIAEYFNWRPHKNRRRQPAVVRGGAVGPGDQPDEGQHLGLQVEDSPEK
ncbi:uncharacterized protein [Penaeus vannamei]|uniref:uncharacterized protein n=1 Tax=Penaeus vannamei TaxID=6689 RepID=UPI00387F9278